MRKKVFSGVFALALLATAGWGVNRSMNSYADLNDLALRNVLALAQIENPDPGEGGGNEMCLTMQDSTSERILCYGGYIYITSYDFDCWGGNGSCSGERGSMGVDCHGNSFDSRETINRNC